MTHYAEKNFGEADDMLPDEIQTVGELWISETGEVPRQTRNSTHRIVRDISLELVSHEYSRHL